MDFYGFKRVQALITQKGVDYLTEILGTRKKDEDSDGGQ